MNAKKRSPRQQVRIAIVVALLLSLALASWAWLQRPHYSGLPVLKLGGEFSLHNANGEAFSLSQSNGRVRLLTFGFTHCPDICPTTLARYRAVLEALAGDAAQLQPIMVSVDPVRDTPAILQKYVSYFSPQIIGLTGTPEAIAAVAKQYAAYVSFTGDEVSHSDYLYLIDKDGRVRRLFDQQAGVAMIVQEARALMKEPRETRAESQTSISQAHAPRAEPLSPWPDAQPPAPESMTITAQQAWVREVPPVSPAAALFVELNNAIPESIAITAMTSPAAGRVEWHDMRMRDGQMHMTQRDTIELPAGVTTLAPGGSHLMLMDLRQPLAVGDSVQVSLSLANGQTLTFTAPVRRSRPDSHDHH